MGLINNTLKSTGKLDLISLTLCIVGSRKIYRDDDYGQSPWHIFAPNLRIYGFDADPEACDAANAALEAQGITWFERHYPLALGKQVGESTLYITDAVHCSSLYEPNLSYTSRFQGFNPGLNLAATVQVETTTLDAFAKTEGLESVEVLKVDVQGADLDVLQGGQHLLAASTLAIIVEVEFSEVYRRQPLFGDVDAYLRSQGFVLFDLLTHDAWCRLPRYLSPFQSQRRAGQLLWADAIYLRDLLADHQRQHNAHLQTPEHLLKLAAIADALDFPDYALEVLTQLTLQYGKTAQWDCRSEIFAILDRAKGVISADIADLPIVKALSQRLP
ncbi:FkbM family methyltransferase [Thermosynechococcus sp. M55_K2018_012]|uniref:FkbM family methyltransferase n=1 Tax=Thermosynechococcus sp. M55_K2018_012 TaxID=2747809 RepID=UPI0019E2ACE5|nr:FkbM family methyltransferase [Thermosynechococcus sp. M55_K2018_012]HIK48642.1 FkbM family methyltransferase [Thermosynechococcus sp. M55_K2018_012]